MKPDTLDAIKDYTIAIIIFLFHPRTTPWVAGIAIVAYLVIFGEKPWTP